jgi:hypothetical protein
LAEWIYAWGGHPLDQREHSHEEVAP